jgi:HK97 gp10 family phage protein
MPAPSKTLEGLDQTFKNLDNLGLNLASCVRTACWKLGGKILMQAKNNARTVFTGTPSDDPEPGTPTGRLMGSITMKANFGPQAAGLNSPAKSDDAIGKPGGDGKDAPTVAVGTNVNYAPYPEFGTRKMHARSFMYPAFFSLENDFEKTLIGIVERKAALRNFNQRLPIFDPEGNWE